MCACVFDVQWYITTPPHLHTDKWEPLPYGLNLASILQPSPYYIAAFWLLALSFLFIQ